MVVAATLGWHMSSIRFVTCRPRWGARTLRHAMIGSGDQGVHVSSDLCDAQLPDD